MDSRLRGNGQESDHFTPTPSPRTGEGVGEYAGVERDADSE